MKPAASGGERAIKVFNQDKTASQCGHLDREIPVQNWSDLVLDIITNGKNGFLKCAWDSPKGPCKCGGKTHVVDVVWERDPGEQDRRWVRMEVRCEEGRGYLLLIRNHAGKSYFDTVLLDDSVVSPFAEGARW